MGDFKTIHIFGFGTVQVIKKDSNVQALKNDVATAADAVIDEVWDKRPTDHTGQKEYHAINVFQNLFVDWQPKEKIKGFRIKMSELNSTLFDNLVDEIDFLNLQNQNAPITPTPSTPPTPPINPPTP